MTRPLMPKIGVSTTTLSPKWIISDFLQLSMIYSFNLTHIQSGSHVNFMFHLFNKYISMTISKRDFKHIIYNLNIIIFLHLFMDIYGLGLVAVAALGIIALFIIKNQRKQTNNISKDGGSKQKRVNQSKGSKEQALKLQQKQKSKQPQILKSNVVQQSPDAFIKIKKLQQIQSEYKDMYFGSFRLKAANSVYSITCIDFKGSKILLSTAKNQMVLFNLKSWKKDSKHSQPQKYFVSLDNNGASAVCIGQNYYYAALNFDKTIVYYEFLGQNGVYFKQVCKFERNILKSNASLIHVPKSQTYIVTAGTGADTVIDVWSMKGQKLSGVNSFQIQHYNIFCGLKDILIRGWTSQIKIFSIVDEKDGQFKKLDKALPLPHQQSPLYSAIDNRDMFAVSISKSHKIKVWYLADRSAHRTVESNQSSNPELYKYRITKCALYTFEPAVGHFKTLVVLTHEKGFLVVDTNLKVLESVEGIQISDIYLNGTAKAVILGVVNNQGQILLWKFNKELEKVDQIRI